MTRTLIELQDFAVHWFPGNTAARMQALLDALPESTLEIIARVRDKHSIQFESISADRAQFTLLRVLSRVLCSPMTPITVRAEIELTHRCNFVCEYCQTRLGPNASECALDEEGWLAAIRQFAQTGCKFLHLNGGEVSLLPFVPNLIRCAKRYGMEVGLSSNGSGDVDFYRRAVDAGLDFIHVSYDVAERQRFEKLCARRGAWDRVDAVVAWLTNDGRKVNSRLFVVGNLVLTPDTLKELPATVAHLATLGVDDIKLLPLPALFEAHSGLELLFSQRVRPEVAGLIGNGPRFRMLRSRLRKLFEEPIHGTRAMDVSGHCLQACELGSEQVMVRKDGVIAPCFIYMREQYKANDYGLGSIADNINSRANVAHSVFSTSYLRDPTCRQFCPDMIRDANANVQRAVADCIVDLLEGPDNRNLLLAGEIVCSYRELEAPTGDTSVAKQDGFFCVPHAYAMSASEMASGAECQIESVPNTAVESVFWNAGTDPRAVVHSRIVGHFLRTSGNYASFRVTADTQSAARRLKSHLKSKFDDVAIGATLVTAGDCHGSWRIPLPMVIGI